MDSAHGKVNLAEKFAQIHELWSPRIAAELHGMAVKLVKIRDAFEWDGRP